MHKEGKKVIEELEAELEELRHQLFEAHEVINAIRTGQVDALVLESSEGNQLYTLESADIAYRVFIENMTEGAITLNREGVILYCNMQFATMINASLSTVIGTSFNNYIDKSDALPFTIQSHKYWETGCKEEVTVLKGDKTIPVQLSLTPLQLDGQTMLSIIVTDLSVQKQAQHQLEEANRKLVTMNHALEESNHDLQQFASIASHDLQEPLRKIQMFSRILTENEADTSEKDSQLYLHKIIDSTKRMRSLIMDVLNYSKLSAQDPEPEVVDLNLVMNELAEDFELIVAEKKASIQVTSLPIVTGSKGQFRQLFQNIVSNALKFSRPDQPPVITIGTQMVTAKLSEVTDRKGAYALIRIKDNGIGFDEKYLSNIFALFERLHTKDKFEGTGIGLAISKKIVEKHGGAITAKSMPGEGAEFLIWLPVFLNHKKDA